MSPTVVPRDVLIYVKSDRIISKVLPADAQGEGHRIFHENGYLTCLPAPSFSGHGGFVGDTFFDSGRFGGRPLYAQELPDEERDALRRARQVAGERGLTLHVVDVGKESPLRRVVEEHLRDFPVLFRLGGRRLEGVSNFTAERLEEFLSD